MSLPCIPQACLLVIAFPVPVASEQGNAAVTTLASTLLLLAGPSHHWTHVVTPGKHSVMGLCQDVGPWAFPTLVDLAPAGKLL